MSRLGDLIDAGEYVEADVCSDCLLWIENRDDSGASSDWDRASVEQTLKTYEVLVSDESDEFSRSTCGACGTDLAGHRTEVKMIKHSDLAGR
ncbi:hypothetical protein [Gordonia malaquae]|uniref:hypothetical protein n=1 Tax=Gordonia malaquae TaxID=410332 RepID=UPI0030183C38